MKNKVLIIVGPTASGKSDLSIKLAKKFNGEIISADSRQVYKWLNIGTGKITKKEMAGIPHHLLDVAGPKEIFTASDYKKLASKALDDITSRGKLPIVVGGTGFYIDTLTGKTNLPEVPPNPSLRKKLDKFGTDKLFKILEKKDPVRAENIDRNNRVRLIRALEIIESLGKVPIVHEIRSANTKYQFIYVGIKLPQEELDKRIHIRLVKRLPGIIREVRKLHKLGVSWKRMFSLGLEYRHVHKYVRKIINKKEMTEELFSDIRAYSKRQMTWFKTNKKITWFTPSSVEGFSPNDYENIEKFVSKKI